MFPWSTPPSAAPNGEVFSKKLFLIVYIEPWKRHKFHENVWRILNLYRSTAHPPPGCQERSRNSSAKSFEGGWRRQGGGGCFERNVILRTKASRGRASCLCWWQEPTLTTCGVKNEEFQESSLFHGDRARKTTSRRFHERFPPLATLHHVFKALAA